MQAGVLVGRCVLFCAFGTLPGLARAVSCGAYELSDAEVVARLERVHSLPLIYTPDDVARMEQNPCVVTYGAAHRGDVAVAPQNTWPALASAVEKQARFIELDVFLNSDQEPIVLHDRLYKRPHLHLPFAGNVSGPSEECWGRDFELDPWSLMRACDVSRGDEGFFGTQVPLLEEVLQDFGDSRSTFLVELKKSRDMPLLAEKVVGLLERYVADPAQRWVISFEDEALQIAGERVNRGRLLAITRPFEPVLDLAQEQGYQAILTDLSGWNERTLAASAARGIALGGYTITRTTTEEQLRALRLGGAFFVTDRLDEFQVLSGRREP